MQSLTERLLTEALQFTSTDFEANLNGRQSPGQNTRLQLLFKRARTRTWLMLGAGLLLVIIFVLVVWSATFSPLKAGNTILMVLAAPIGIWLLMQGIKNIRQLAFLRGVIEEQSVLSGLVRIRKPEAIAGRPLANAVTDYIITVNSTAVHVSRALYLALEDGEQYLMHSLPYIGPWSLGNGNILSMMPVREVPEVLATTPSVINAVVPPQVESSVTAVQRADEIFVSYARVNQPFVRSLVDDLRGMGVDVWFDVEDIPPSASWWKAIQQGILRANAFLFVISEASLRSEVCQWELAFALEHGKRILPVAFEDVFRNRDLLNTLATLTFQTTDGIVVSAGQNWSRLSAINFITGQADLAQRVVSALRVDPDYLEQHTRLLQWAVEWNAGGRSDSTLLQGKPLDDACHWLASSDGRNPPPHTLHRDYIGRSVRAENQRILTLNSNEAVLRKVREQTQQLQQHLALDAARRNRGQLTPTNVITLVIAIGALVILGLVSSATPSRSATLSATLTVQAQGNLIAGYPAVMFTLAPSIFTPAGAQRLAIGEQTGALRAGESVWQHSAPVAHRLELHVIASWEARIEVSLDNVLIPNEFDENGTWRGTLPVAGTYRIVVMPRSADVSPNAVFILNANVEPVPTSATATRSLSEGD